MKMNTFKLRNMNRFADHMKRSDKRKAARVAFRLMDREHFPGPCRPAPPVVVEILPTGEYRPGLRPPEPIPNVPDTPFLGTFPLDELVSDSTSFFTVLNLLLPIVEADEEKRFNAMQADTADEDSPIEYLDDSALADVLAGI